MVSEENRAETVAYQQAMTYIQSSSLCTACPNFEYSKDLLNSLHWILRRHHHPVIPQDSGGRVQFSSPRPAIRTQRNTKGRTRTMWLTSWVSLSTGSTPATWIPTR